ncbi:MAG: efflux RND transporter periplasmic adaptor subunit [Cyanobacteria bacterium RUI128]|nr:efflux RND transporter periplasmic adaptor subunit [Cyanobacteria bacterium RUI128]
MQKVNMKKVAMPEIVVEKVQSMDIIKSYESPARVVSKYQVQVEARIDGYLLRSYFKEGDFVKAGQVLFEIEPQEYQYALQQAQANMKSAKAKQVYYDKQSARAKQLVDADYIAKADYDNAVAQRDSYRADYQRTLSAYNDARRNLGYTKVKAPVAGRVGMITVTVGNYVRMNAGALTTINSVNPMYVTFPLEANDFNDLTRIDGAANVKRRVVYVFSNGTKYDIDGVLDFIDNKIDPGSGTITLRATFNNDNGRLMAGDYGRAIIYSTKTDPVPVIPTKAIQENQEGKYVYKVDEKGIPTLIYIKVLEHKGDISLIKEGLQTGDRIAVGGLQQIIPGTPAKIVSALPPENHKKPNIFVRILNKIKRMLKGNK